MSNMSKQEVIDEMVSEGYDYDSAFRMVFGDTSSYDDSDSDLDLLARADEAAAYNERCAIYMSVMRQDFPKDFADDDPFTAALLDSCEKRGETDDCK